jgi:DNA-binding transcriptional LysR family regulator
MNRADDIVVFIAVVEAGSLTAAARRLGRSLQAISRALGLLEQSIGITLIRRTTRRCSPTEAGAAFYRRVKPAFAEIHDAWTEAAEQRDEPSGVLRISAPVMFAPVYVVPAVAKFMERYPRVEVDLTLTDTFADLIAQDLDLAVRIGQLPDSDLKARRLGVLRRVVFGTPDYFARHGYPQHPSDLVRHQCVVRPVAGQDSTWPFQIGGKLRRIKVGGRFRADASASAIEAVAQGLGIGFGPLWQMRPLLDAGRVEVVLAPFEPPPVPVQLVWHPTRMPLARTRIFADCLVEGLRNARDLQP